MQAPGWRVEVYQRREQAQDPIKGFNRGQLRNLGRRNKSVQVSGSCPLGLIPNFIELDPSLCLAPKKHDGKHKLPGRRCTLGSDNAFAILRRADALALIVSVDSFSFLTEQGACTSGAHSCITHQYALEEYATSNFALLVLVAA